MNTSSGNAPNQVISDFLFAAIENNSENIMFTETKVGITFALYGLITYALVEARDIIIGTIRTISQYGPCCKYMCFVFLLVTFSCMLVSTYYLLRTIKPRHYPILGDTDISEEQKRLWSVGWNKDKTGLEMTYNVYYGNLVVQDEIGFIKCAAYELLRRNLIRILKRRYFDNAMWFFGGFVLSILVVGIATVIVTVWTE